jgi:hypothetical protein
MWKKDWRREFR